MSFSSAQLVGRSLRHFAGRHAGTLAGVAVAAAVLTGALAVGDSVRLSLRDMALARIGRADFALASPERFFRADLAERLRSNSSSGPTCAILMLRGSAATPDDSARANQVQVLGVDSNFWAMALDPTGMGNILEGGVVLGQALAAQLHAAAGSEIILRVEKPSLLSLESPLSPKEMTEAGMRLKVTAVASDAQFGRFGLQAGQAPPLNAFVPAARLQAEAGLEGRANVILTSGIVAPLRGCWTAADAGLEWRTHDGVLELRTDRVFLDPETARAAVAAAPAQARPVLAYFVNELRAASNATPYSMVAGLPPAWLPPKMGDDKIVINEWLADDLGAKPGDLVTLSYYVPGPGGRLLEKKSSFHVRAVWPMNGLAADRSLMPDFPGIANAEKTENWDAGFAIDLGKIRPKDELYWKQLRGSPKAFVTLAAAKKMWANRFGDLTAIRFEPGAVSPVKITNSVAAALDPAAAGLAYLPFRSRALSAASQAEDFGGLFIGLSIFLVAAALVLLALLFQFGLESRAVEIGTLLAVGWRPQAARRLFLWEGIAVALPGGAIGAVLGLFYARGILWGLSTIWSPAVAGAVLHFHATPASILIGALSAVAVAGVVIRFSLRAQFRRPARELLDRGHELERQGAGRRRWPGVVGFSALLLAALGVAVAGAALSKGSGQVASFFAAGSLLLAAGIVGTSHCLRGQGGGGRALTLCGLAWRGCTRRPKRSTATVAMFACGTFLVMAVAVGKMNASAAGGRSSGTGGFALVGSSSLPVVQDLDSKAGRDFFALDAATMKDVRVVPFRVHDGDDASCLNLNRPQSPRILGVAPGELKSRGAFHFVEELKPGAGWEALAATNGGTNEVPAVADASSLEWSLHKQVGETVDYLDGRGRAFKIRLVGALAGSLLQGNLIIGNAAFESRFPDESGWRYFLIDAPPQRAAAVAADLTRALRGRGVEFTPTVDRLNAYNAVQNAYVDTFQALGALGLLLGGAGLGAVVLRNVLERRRELAVMAASGFRESLIRRLLFGEHAALEGIGLIIGTASALTMLPGLHSTGTSLSFRAVAAALGVVFLSGLVFVWLAVRVAWRGRVLNALREN